VWLFGKNDFMRHISYSARYLLLETLFILVGAYLVLFAGTNDGIMSPTIMSVSALLITIVSGLLFLQKKLIVSNEIVRPLQVILAVLLLTTLTSLDPRRSIVETWLIAVSFWVLFATVSIIQMRVPAELIIKVLLIIVAIVMVFYWAEVIKWYLEWLAVSPGQWIPTVAYRLVAPNFMAMLLNLCLMVAISRFTVSSSNVSKFFLAGWILSASGLLYLTSSRGGWVGTVAGIGTFLLISLVLYRHKWLALLRYLGSHKVILGLLLLGAGAGLAAGGYLIYKQSLQPTHGPIFTARVEFWGPAWQAFLESPLVGKGPFTFISTYLQMIPSPPNVMFLHAHSIYFDLLSTTGLLGIVPVIWTIVVFGKVLWRRIKTQKGMDLALSAGSAAAAAVFLTHGIFDSVYHSPPTTMLVFCMVMATGVSQPLEEKKVQGSKVNFAFLSCLVIGFAWWYVWAAIPINKGVASANGGEWIQAVPEFEAAVSRDPGMAIAHQQLGLARSMLAEKGEAESLRIAIDEFEKTVKLDPYWASNWVNLGALYKTQGDGLLAEKAFKKAVDLSPQWAVFWLNLGDLYEVEGDLTQAETAYIKVLDLQPDWAQAYFWRATDLRARVATDWLKNHPAGEPPSEEALRGELAADRSRASDYIGLATLYIEQNRPEAARELLDTASMVYFSTGKEQIEYSWLQAELSAADGNYQDAVLQGQKAVDGYLFQGIYGPGSYGTLIYAPLMFRRPAASLEFVPQLTRIMITDRVGEWMLKLRSWYLETGEIQKADEIYRQVQYYIPDSQK
jgi:tetratricopeptide (TPR) repeat protein/O-antigen ligase